jgi:hypothetical protein
MKNLIAALLVSFVGSSAFAAKSQVGALRDKLASVEQKRFGASGKWSVTKSVDKNGVRRFTGNRPLSQRGGGMGLMTTRFASGTFSLKGGKVSNIRVRSMGTAY